MNPLNKTQMIKELTQIGLDRYKIIEAIDFVCKLDKVDGFTQIDLGIVTAIRTSIIAISSGLKQMEINSDSSSIYEAVVMLQQIIMRYNHLELK